jgi:hypothetical protein
MAQQLIHLRLKITKRLPVSAAKSIAGGINQDRLRIRGDEHERYWRSHQCDEISCRNGRRSRRRGGFWQESPACRIQQSLVLVRRRNLKLQSHRIRCGVRILAARLLAILLRLEDDCPGFVVYAVLPLFRLQTDSRVIDFDRSSHRRDLWVQSRGSGCGDAEMCSAP